MYILCKIIIVVGYKLSLILLRLSSNWLEKYRMHVQGKKIVRAKEFAFAGLCTNDYLICKLASKINSEKSN